MCSNRSEPAAARPIADLGRHVYNLLYAMSSLGLVLVGNSLAELKRVLILKGATPEEVDTLFADAEREQPLAFPFIENPTLAAPWTLPPLGSSVWLRGLRGWHEYTVCGYEGVACFRARKEPENIVLLDQRGELAGEWTRNEAEARL
jgi:hypothetical protein